MFYAVSALASLIVIVGIGANGHIEIVNCSNDSLPQDSLHVVRNPSAKELFGPYDLPHPPLPDGNWLRIQSLLSERTLVFDSRPPESITPIVFELAFEGSIEVVSNYLRFQVVDANFLHHRRVQAQQLLPAPGAIHTIPKDGSVYTVQLPGLQYPAEGPYALWLLTLERTLQGDLNEDGRVDFRDFSLLAGQWHQTSSKSEAGGAYHVSDIDLDRRVDARDLMGLSRCWLDAERSAR
jgi:hypothetical protein